MTLHNNARHLAEATDSLLGQRERDFVLLMLDDGSTDGTEEIARAYERQDARVHYRRHAVREGMVATWREVAGWAAAQYPDAPYFAWVSDHDRWHPDWLMQTIAALDAAKDVVLAYPITLRIDEAGSLAEKEPRSFDTSGIADARTRWRRFCHEGVGSGDMVYGVMRMRALRAAGCFRPVLNPDRLLVGELSLHGQIRQVPEPLWFRRQAAVASIARQRTTLFAGAVPPWFFWPAAVQHAYLLWREYGGSTAPARFTRPQLLAMLARYELATLWRGFRKTDVSKSLGRGVDNVHWVKKLAKKAVHHAIYYTAVAFHRARGRLRRIGRRTVYELLMLTHRTGLRGPRGGTRTP
jgi:glycosyltransferase involved in cell wall biosynthesis